jgi:hypothetical protein
MVITSDNRQLAGAWLGNAPRYSCAEIAMLVSAADSWGKGLDWGRARYKETPRNFPGRYIAGSGRKYGAYPGWTLQIYPTKLTRSTRVMRWKGVGWMVQRFLGANAAAMSLVVILIVNNVGVAVFKPKHNSPIVTPSGRISHAALEPTKTCWLI